MENQERWFIGTTCGLLSMKYVLRLSKKSWGSITTHVILRYYIYIYVYLYKYICILWLVVELLFLSRGCVEQPITCTMHISIYIYTHNIWYIDIYTLGLLGLDFLLIGAKPIARGNYVKFIWCQQENENPEAAPCPLCHVDMLWSRLIDIPLVQTMSNWVEIALEWILYGICQL